MKQRRVDTFGRIKPGAALGFIVFKRRLSFALFPPLRGFNYLLKVLNHAKKSLTQFNSKR